MDRRHVIGLLVCAAPLATSAAAQTPSGVRTAEAVVRELLAAMQSNDAVRIRAAFAPSATQAYGNDAPKTGSAFSRWLQSDIIDRRGRVANAKLSVSGNEVVVTGQYSNNAGYSSAANFLFKVENGQIVSWQMRY